ncbi:hypothetical protein YC2023_078592 [Brassica napus]
MLLQRRSVSGDNDNYICECVGFTEDMARFLIFSSSFEKYNRLWQNKFDLNHNSWVVRRTQNGVKHSEFKTYHIKKQLTNIKNNMKKIK